MKLDSRIKEGKKPLTPFDTEEAKPFVGKECYFAHNYTSFRDLQGCSRGSLTAVDYKNDMSFVMADGGISKFPYIIPCEWTEQKRPQWRAFKDHAEYKEFLNDGIIESWVKIKGKGDGKIYELMYIGGGDDKICLGGMMLSVSNLFKDFELFNESTREWQPFGVEEVEEE